MTYKFNSTLFQSLLTILNTTAVGISNRITTASHDTILRGVRRGDIRVEVFVEICNQYHLNHRFFFFVKEKGLPKGDIIIPEDEWTPIEYHPEALRYYYNNAQKIRCNEMATQLSNNRHDIDKVFVCAPRKSNNKIESVKEESNTYERVASQEDEHIVYSSWLFSNLPAIFGISAREFERESGQAINFYVYGVRYADVRVALLVDVCNRFHIRIGNFFVHQDGIRLLPDDFVCKEEWTPIVFHPERLDDFCKRGGAEITQRQLIKILGYTYPRYMRAIKTENNPITATALADICNRLHIPISYFFESDEDIIRTRVSNQVEKTIKTKDAQIEAIKRENNRLAAQVQHLNWVVNLNKQEEQ